MSPGPDMDSLKMGINQSPKYPMINEPTYNYGPKKPNFLPSITGNQQTSKKPKSNEHLPNIFEHKPKILDLDDIRRFDVDEIIMSKRSKAGLVSMRPDIHHPAECVDRFKEAQIPLDESLDACKEYIVNQNEGERKQIQNTYMSINTPFGQLVGKRRRLMYKINKKMVEETGQPQIIFNERDYKSRIGFLRLKTDRMEAMSLWKTNDIIGNNRMGYIKEI